MKITFVQSYVSTEKPNENKGIYAILQNHFGKLRWVGLLGNSVRNLSKKESLKIAFDAVMKSRKDELVFCWNGEIALYTWFVSKMLHRPRMILGQNLIVNPKHLAESKKANFKGQLYHRALNDKKFYVTVNSPELIQFYSEALDARKEKFITVYDSMVLNDYEKSIVARKRLNNNGLYIAGGGKQDRDIETFMKVAGMMPDIKFKAVFLKEQLPKGMVIPNNVELHTNTDRNTFYEIMGNGAIMLMPLKAYSPCGLSVVQKAMLMGQNIVGTDTPSMRVLIPNNKHGILTPMGDVDAMVSALRFVLSHPMEAANMRENSKKLMDELFSPRAVAQQIIMAIETTMKRTKE